jgi:hypothetical protein
MTRKLLLVAVTSAVSAISGVAFAQGANDGPKYPNMESHKQYQASRNQDHNNPSPRYTATTTSAQHPAYRNQDHNNPSPRYATTTKQSAPRTIATRNSRYNAHAMRRLPVTRNHG